MARLIINHSLMSHFTGRIGDFVIRQTKNGPILAKRPEHGKWKPTQKQKRVTSKFALASKYASIANRDPRLRKHYQKHIGKSTSVYTAAFKAFMQDKHIPLPE